MLTENAISRVREERPLVQAITNYVTINDCANIALAVGGSPAMCESKREVHDFVSLIRALYVNVGTLNDEQRESIYISMERASQLGVPIVLDPVGVVALENRLRLVEDLLDKFDVTCVNGNVAEIKCLSGRDALAKGVDSLDAGKDVSIAAEELCQNYDTAVLVSGERDYISDGDKIFAVDNGSPLFEQITGAGCMLGMLTGVFVGAHEDVLEASLASALTMSVAGEMAAENIDRSTDVGSFKVKLFDAMAAITDEKLQEKGDYHKIG